MSVRFTSDVLKSLDNLQTFLNGGDTLKTLIARKNDKLPAHVDIDKLKLGPWQITWIRVITPLYKITAIFLLIMSISISTVLLPARLLFGKVVMYPSQRVFAQANYLWEVCSDTLDDNLRATWYKTDWLVRIRNCVQRSQVDLYDSYGCEATPKNLIDSKILQRLGNINEHHLAHPWDGMCWGICEWYSYLYLALEEHVPDEEKRLILIGQLFTDGAPREAMLLQKLQPPLKSGVDTKGIYTPSFLPMKKSEIEMFHVHPNPTEMEEAYEEVDLQLRLTEEGVYSIGVPRHRMSVFKTPKGFYILDPNGGIYKREFLMSRFKNYYSDKTSDLLAIQKVSLQSLDITQAAQAA